MPYIIPRAKLEVGMKINNWTVLEIPSTAHGKIVCQCKCGVIRSRMLNVFLTQASRECITCANARHHTTHGDARHGHRGRARLYHIWDGMLYRCSPAGSTLYPRYYDRGVRVCDEWAKSYAAFRDWALSHGYRDDLTIDRFPDIEGNYEPGNCRWATPAEQQANTARAKLVTAFGEEKPIGAWAKDPRCAITKSTLHRRIRWGWDAERAITEPTTPRPLRWCLNA